MHPKPNQKLPKLPLRHLIFAKDGKPKGPNALDGPIGKALANFETLPIVNFQPTEAEDIPMDFNKLELSTDQKYLGQIYEAVRKGSIETSLATRDPGNISLARWLTIANRILRLYVSTESPSNELLSLVDCIMKVYVPSWFQIKKNWRTGDGSVNLFNMIVRARSLQDEHARDIVLKRIEYNGYFLHPENILLSMILITDENVVIRKLGWKRIKKARDQITSFGRKTRGVRCFEIPKIFSARSYHESIDWSVWQNDEDGNESEMVIYPFPPILRALSPYEINEWATEQAPPKYPLPDLPCHSQAVERHIRLVSEA